MRKPLGLVKDYGSRAEWLHARRSDVTASEVAAVFGLHPYLSQFDLWSRKAGIKPEAHAGDDESPALRRGRYLEAVAVKLISEAMPEAVLEHNDGSNGRHLRYWNCPHLRIGATPDLLVEHDQRGPGVIQIKSIEPSVFTRVWQAGARDAPIEVPLWVGLQALTEARLTGSSWACVAALRVGFGLEFDLVDVPLHDGAWQRTVEGVREFWRSVAAKEEPTPDYARDGRLIASLYPQSVDSKTVDLSHDNELVSAIIDREQAKDRIKADDMIVEHADALIRHRAGDAARVIAGGYELSLKTQHTKAYTVSARTTRPIRVKERRRQEDAA